MGKERGSDAEPFSFGAGSRAVLLIHGFTGTPFEMRLLGEHLAERGFAVDGPRLAGHGGTTSDLAHTTWHDWYRSASDALDRLRERTRAGRVAVVGLSMGGLLTLELARRRPDELAAIAVLAAPLWLPPEAETFSRLTARVPLVRQLALPKLAGSDIRDPDMKRRNGIAQGRAGMPLPALASLIELGHHLRDQLGDVRAPTLLMHSEQDHTVPFACMDAIAHRLIHAASVRRIGLRESFHVVTLDVEKEKVFAAVDQFIGEHISQFL